MESEHPPLCPAPTQLLSTVAITGEKLRLAQRMHQHEAIGMDSVAECTNALVCAGGRPFLFRSAIIVGKGGLKDAETASEGIRNACLQVGCRFDETPPVLQEMLMQEKEYRLTGFAVGTNDVFSGGKPTAGDVIIGITSSGIHTGGFELARRVLGDSDDLLETQPIELSCSIGEELMKPVRLYANAFLAVRDNVRVKTAAYISGGLNDGFRTLAKNDVLVRIERSQIAVPPIFDLIGREGKASQEEMFEQFNMGLGLLFITSAEDADRALETLYNCGEQAWVVGEIAQGLGFELV